MATASATKGPNPLRIAWSVLRVLTSVKPPTEYGSGTVDHSALGSSLSAVASAGVVGLADRPFDKYLAAMAEVDPGSLTRPEALAYWLNVYNAGALRVAAEAHLAGVESVLRVPGGFDAPFITIGSEALSLDAVEHAKIRRFGDPRIHGALVCGSVSCPTLRSRPYHGIDLDEQLDDQMGTFLRGGGAQIGDDSATLSRVFLWYGGDFTRPHRMPAWLPARKSKLLGELARWDKRLAEVTSVSFQTYDWGLRCAVA